MESLSWWLDEGGRGTKKQLYTKFKKKKKYTVAAKNSWMPETAREVKPNQSYNSVTEAQTKAEANALANCVPSQPFLVWIILETFGAQNIFSSFPVHVTLTTGTLRWMLWLRRVGGGLFKVGQPLTLLAIALFVNLDYIYINIIWFYPCSRGLKTMDILFKQ